MTRSTHGQAACAVCSTLSARHNCMQRMHGWVWVAPAAADRVAAVWRGGQVGRGQRAAQQGKVGQVGAFASSATRCRHCRTLSNTHPSLPGRERGLRHRSTLGGQSRCSSQPRRGGGARAAQPNSSTQHRSIAQRGTRSAALEDAVRLAESGLAQHAARQPGVQSSHCGRLEEGAHAQSGTVVCYMPACGGDCSAAVRGRARCLHPAPSSSPPGALNRVASQCELPAAGVAQHALAGFVSKPPARGMASQSTCPATSQCCLPVRHRSTGSSPAHP